MPGAAMDGVGLSRWISEHRPGLRVILTSGHGHAARAAQAAADFLAKPYRVMETVLRIRALLNDALQNDE